MSEFNAFMAGMLDDALEFLGTSPFFWNGQQIAGDFAKLDESFDVEEGGKQLRVTASLFAARPQFGSGALPRKGQRVKVGSETYEIGHVESDAVGVTLFLGADIRRSE